MTVKFQRERIVAMINNNPGGIGGLQAFEKIPREVQDNELPAIVVRPGPGRNNRNQMGNAINYKTRTFYLDFLYSRVDVGTEGEAQEFLEPYFDRVTDFFEARPGLWDTEADQPEDSEFDSQVTSDEGFARIQYGKDVCYGIRFNLEVIEISEIEYAD